MCCVCVRRVDEIRVYLRRHRLSELRVKGPKMHRARSQNTLFKDLCIELLLFGWWKQIRINVDTQGVQFGIEKA